MRAPCGSFRHRLLEAGLINQLQLVVQRFVDRGYKMQSGHRTPYALLISTIALACFAFVLSVCAQGIAAETNIIPTIAKNIPIKATAQGSCWEGSLPLPGLTPIVV